MTSKRKTSKRDAYIVSKDRDHDLTLTVTDVGIYVLDNITGHQQFITATVLETIANSTKGGELTYTSSSHYSEQPHVGSLTIPYSVHDRLEHTYDL